jgi:hypothetical protein
VNQWLLLPPAQLVLAVVLPLSVLLLPVLRCWLFNGGFFNSGSSTAVFRQQAQQGSESLACFRQAARSIAAMNRTTDRNLNESTHF